MNAQQNLKYLLTRFESLLQQANHPDRANGRAYGDLVQAFNDAVLKARTDSTVALHFFSMPTLPVSVDSYGYTNIRCHSIALQCEDAIARLRAIVDPERSPVSVQPTTGGQLVINNHGTITQSNLSQGHGNALSVSSQSGLADKLVEVIDALNAGRYEFDLPQEEDTAVAAQVVVLRSQAEAARQNPGIVKSALATVGHALQSATKCAATTAARELVQRAIAGI